MQQVMVPFAFCYDKRRLTLMIVFAGVVAFGGIMISAHPKADADLNLRWFVPVLIIPACVLMIMAPLFPVTNRRDMATHAGLVFRGKTYPWEKLTAIGENPIPGMSQLFRDPTTLFFGPNWDNMVYWSVLPQAEGRQLLDQLKQNLREKLMAEFDSGGKLVFRQHRTGMQSLLIFQAAICIIGACGMLVISGFSIYDVLTRGWSSGLYARIAVLNIILPLISAPVFAWFAYAIYRDQQRDVHVDKDGIGFGKNVKELIPWNTIENILLRRNTPGRPMLIVRTGANCAFRTPLGCRNDWFLCELLAQMGGGKWREHGLPGAAAAWQRMGQILIVSGLLLSIAFIGLTAAKATGVNGAIDKFALWRNSATAPGTLAGVGLALAGPELHYVFRDATGREYSSREVTGREFDDASNLPVYYLPSDPRVNQLTEPALLPLTIYWWPGIMGGYFLLVLLHAHILARRRKRAVIDVIDEYDPFQIIRDVYAGGRACA